MKPDSRFELVSFAGPDELADAVAVRWLAHLSSTAGSSAPYCAALSGGRIARRFFSASTARAKLNRAALRSVDFFWGDERCVPPTDPESNFGLALQAFLQPLAIPENQIHRVRGEAPPDVAAAEAEAELRRFAPAGANGQPQLDLVFLGMGEDGHVASLFPGEAENVISSTAVFRAVIAPKPPPRRISLGYSAIAAAKEVWVLASGSGKELALRQSLAPGGQTPLGRVLGLRNDTKIFTDIPLDKVTAKPPGSA